VPFPPVSDPGSMMDGGYIVAHCTLHPPDIKAVKYFR
jgi:hypothetical protein